MIKKDLSSCGHEDKNKSVYTSYHGREVRVMMCPKCYGILEADLRNDKRIHVENVDSNSIFIQGKKK